MEIDEELYEVVISGVSGKYPLSEDIEELKENLLAKNFLITEDDCRWNREHWNNIPVATGKINVVEKFDDTFFGVHSGVSAMMDPLTRVTIERAFEAVMDAGLNPKLLRDSETAVYTSSCTSDSESIGCDDKLIAKFWLVGNAKALLPNRISYSLNLKGPSWTIDSSWIGGIQCLSQAITDIRKGRIESALVGVTNVILFPDISQHWLGLGKLSTDGQCFPFQENANGYARSEGTVFLFLQRENEAKRIYAKLNKADTMFCGDESETFLKPKEEAFKKFLRSFYNDSHTLGKPVAFVEADGSADKYLDEIELNSIGEVLCKENNNKKLYVGSMKGNLGHTEAASPLVSLSKALIALDSEVILPNRDFQNANKRIKTLGLLDIVTTPTPFPEGKHAAVNTIGVTASIGHVLMEQYPKKKKQKKEKNIPKLVLVSARHEDGIFRILNKLESMPYDEEYFSLVNDVFKENITGHFYRGYTVLGTNDNKLHMTLETGTPTKVPIWFVFAGMGSQWPGMGADLMHLPIFASTIHEIDSYLAPLGIDIYEVICSDDPLVLKNIINAFVGIVAVQIGMVDVLKAIGIVPDGMFGHSLGENMCAYADGCFTKYQAIMAAYYRGKASKEISIPKGLMAAVGLNYKKLTNLPPNVEIACHNSDDNTTISGPLEEVQSYVEELKKQDIFVRIVNSNNVAYHSKQVLPLAAYVQENISKVVPNPLKRSSKWICTSLPEKDWDLPLAQTSSAEYHVNNFKNTVYFAEACASIPENAHVIEISPHGLFQSILKRMVPGSCFVVPMGKRETSNALNFMLTSIGKLFVVGLQPDINAIYPKVEYPVSRGTPSLATLATWNHETDWNINSYYYRENGIKPIHVSLRESKWRFLDGYKINERTLMPFSTLLIETLHAYETNEPILIFENVTIPNLVEISADETTTIYTQVQQGSGKFEITKGVEVLVSGTIRYSQESLLDIYTDFDKSNDDDDIVGYSFSKNEIQDVLKQYSMNISQEFILIDEITFDDTGCSAVLEWNEDLAKFINSITLVKVFWDLCFTNRGPLLTSKFLKFAVETEKYNSMTSGSKIKIKYYRSVNTFVGPGIQMSGVENSDVASLSLGPEKDLVLQNLQFVCHKNPQVEILENFFMLCGQIVGETFRSEIGCGKDNRVPIVKILLTTDLKNDSNFNKKISLLFESLYRELPKTQIVTKYVTIKDLKNTQKVYDEYALYFIISGNIQAYIDDITELAKQMENIFFLTLNQMSTPPDGFVEITGEKFGKLDTVLWKKKFPVVERIFMIKPYTDRSWLEDLERKLRHLGTYDPILVQWQTKYITDIPKVVFQISTIKPASAIRYIVTTDSDMTGNAKLNHNSPFFHNHLEKGLVMNVLQNQKWGSIRNLIPRLSSPEAFAQSFLSRIKNLKNINVEYVAFVETIQAQPKIKAFEFSGTATTDRRNVMGIGYFQNEYISNPEVYLSWQVPEQWSVEDGVTVPLVYLKAYYALTMKGKFHPHSTVLVYNAYSLSGKALITIALSHECTVYASVNNSLQGKYLKEKFRHSSHLIILNSEFHQTDVEIPKLTRKLGVDIIINAETEKEINDAWKCLKQCGKLVVLNDLPLQNGYEIGLRMFLNSTNLYSIMYEEVLKCDEKVKLEFQKWFNDSMKNGIVKPFERIIVLGNDIDFSKTSTKGNPIQRTVIKLETNSSARDISFTCDPEKTYLIIGTRNEIWFSVVTYLIENNAKKLTLVDTDIHSYNNQYTKRFNLLLENQTDLSLMYISASSLLNKEEIANMIKDANACARLDVAFCISLDSRICEFIDHGLRQHAPEIRQLIFLQCDASSVCESRLKVSQPALNVIWDQNIIDTVVLINKVRKIIENSIRVNSTLFYLSYMSHFKEKCENTLMDKDSQFFPHYSEVEQFVDSFSKDSYFEKVVSKCPPYSPRTQLFPIFALPGLHVHRLKPLFDNLMYPVFSAKYSDACLSANNVAKSLVEPLRKIQPEGPYTIVAESWSGAIAIELVSLLEKSDSEININLILLEGLPKNMQDRLTSFVSFNSPEFYNALDETFSKKLKAEKLQFDRTKPQILGKEKEKFFDLLQCRLKMTKNYTFEGEFLRSKIIAIILKDKPILDTYIDFEKHYGQNIELKIFNEGDYEELIRSKFTSTIINDNVLFKW